MIWSEARPRRVAAVRALPVDADGAYVLRRVLFTDRDAEVRATAARRLAACNALDVEPWLLETFDERSPLVRESVARALARRGGARAIPALRRAIAGDRMWWVRRTSIYALAMVAERVGGAAGELDAFTAALADPFWRVRHGAVRVLAALGSRDPRVREALRDEPPTATLAYLRGTWGPVGIEAPDRAAFAAKSALPSALLDPDPAVVTARLAVDATVDPIALVELLCDPHAPLRSLAADRVAASGAQAAYVAALDWIDEPRIPHAADTVERMLDGLGDPAAELAARVLASGDGARRPGAARWAIAWVVATRYLDLYAAALDRAREVPALRGAALDLADSAELLAWARDDETLVDPVAIELHRRRDRALLELAAAAHPRARALQVDALAHLERWDEVTVALADAHHGPRAIATRHLVRARRVDGDAQLADPDPAVREAALSPAAAPRMVDDRDLFVRRAAIELLAETWRTRDDLPADARDAALRALASPDPFTRAQACRVPHDARGLAIVVELLADPDDGVRAAAHEALARAGDRATSDSRIGLTWAARDLSDLSSLPRIEARAARPSPSPSPSPSPAVPIERRPFPRSAFSVAPLAISGAFDLSRDALRAAEDAGVDLYFWEPAYQGMTRFLRATARRQRARVIAGTYHADAAAIRIDVDRALHALRRDALDVFLLFWTRSPARVDAEAFEVVSELRRAGKVRAVGFSTHDRLLARDAIVARPWDAVMIRHSAAHPGIETELLPTARETGCAVITFSALCYGRMLAGDGAPSPSECYRYSLAQPGVVACISAPRRRRELEENLAALREPTLDPDRIAALRAHGVSVRAENQRFNALMRQPTRDAAAAARELLAAELPPTADPVPRRLPRAATQRAARTSLGTTKRRTR
jgi:hypothetical protein